MVQGPLGLPGEVATQREMWDTKMIGRVAEPQGWKTLKSVTCNPGQRGQRHLQLQVYFQDLGNEEHRGAITSGVRAKIRQQAPGDQVSTAL